MILKLSPPVKVGHFNVEQAKQLAATELLNAQKYKLFGRVKPIARYAQTLTTHRPNYNGIAPDEASEMLAAIDVKITGPIPPIVRSQLVIQNVADPQQRLGDTWHVDPRFILGCSMFPAQIVVGHIDIDAKFRNMALNSLSQQVPFQFSEWVNVAIEKGDANITDTFEPGTLYDMDEVAHRSHIPDNFKWPINRNVPRVLITSYFTDIE